jgi:hypothetical protein
MWQHGGLGAGARLQNNRPEVWISRYLLDSEGLIGNRLGAKLTSAIPFQFIAQPAAKGFLPNSGLSRPMYGIVALEHFPFESNRPDRSFPRKREPSACSGEVDTGSPTKNMRHSRNLEHVPIPTERDML